MTRHETERLWALAADELELDDRRYVELHLQDCPECRDALEAVQIARGALESAKRELPALDWLSTDERVGALVERKMRASARPRWVPFAFGGAALAMAATVAFVLWPAEVPDLPPSEPPLVQVAEPKPIRVEVARGLTRVAATTEPVIAGETLKGGDVLRTSVAGKAFVHLPDASHVRVAAGTQLALTRVDADDVALTLNRGRVAVRASHEPRRGFVVHAGGVDVHVVGTIFSVANGPGGVEVAVAEGEVKVASSEHGETEVKAGQRLSIDRKGRAKLGSINQSLERELSEVQGLAEAVTSVENRPSAVVVPARGGRATLSPPPPSGNLPRLSPEESKARLATVDAPAPAQIEAPAEVELAAAPEVKTITPETEVEVERWDGPGTAFPSLAGGYTRGVPFRRDPEPQPKQDGPASELSEWAAPPPAPAPAAIAPPTLIVPTLEPRTTSQKTATPGRPSATATQAATDPYGSSAQRARDPYMASEPLRDPSGASGQRALDPYAASEPLRDPSTASTQRPRDAARQQATDRARDPYATSEPLRDPSDAQLDVNPFPRPASPPPADHRTRSKSLEQLFFEKAEASLEKGGCDRFLTGLEDIAIERRESAQYARVLRARCFDAQLRPRQAMSEYAKYLETFPNGRFADEAKAALGQ